MPQSINFRQYQTLVQETPEKAETAIHSFTAHLMEMERLKLGFSPVHVKIAGKVHESPNTDFFRCFSLFSRFFDFDWSLLENHEPLAKMYFDRLVALGNSNGVEVTPFFKKESPYPTNFETQTYIKGPYENRAPNVE